MSISVPVYALSGDNTRNQIATATIDDADMDLQNWLWVAVDRKGLGTTPKLGEAAASKWSKGKPYLSTVVMTRHMQSRSLGGWGGVRHINGDLMDCRRANLVLLKMHRSSQPGANQLLYLMRLQADRPYYKIGITADPLARLSQISTSTPFEVELVYEAAFEGGAPPIERALHRMFAEKCVKREWFLLDHNDVAFISSVTSLTDIPAVWR